MKLQESERTEFKSIVVTDIKKEIIAFANCDGGKIYIGIEDDGTVIGVEDSDSVALQVSNMVRDAIKPDLTMFLHYETKEIEQKQVVIIDIQRGTERPYYIAKKGLRPEGVYVRQGYSSVQATDTAIRKMIKETDPNAAVIMCSAMGQQAMVIESIQSGAKDFIVKPFQADRVLEAVQKVVG